MEQKSFDPQMASGSGLKNALSSPWNIASKPPVIFKFASSVSKTIKDSMIIIFFHRKYFSIYNIAVVLISYSDSITYHIFLHDVDLV